MINDFSLLKSASFSLFHYFFNININFIIFFQKCIYQKVSEIVINHTPPPPTPGLKRETVMTMVGVLVMTMVGVS